jgi:hypothetical protein
MTETPDYPAHEIHAPKALVTDLQAALDATFNAHERGEAPDVEQRLREELRATGVSDVPDGWLTRMAHDIRKGEPVVAEVDEDAPGR